MEIWFGWALGIEHKMPKWFVFSISKNKTISIDFPIFNVGTKFEMEIVQ